MGAFFLRHGGLDRNSHLQFYCLVAMILGNGYANVHYFAVIVC